jgi:hypothetical protein
MQLQLSIILEQSEPDRFGIDSFVGTMREFKLYLVVQRELLKAGVIA